jgi:GDP-L-fucose synthase
MSQVILGHRGMVGSALYRLIPDAYTVNALKDRGPVDFRNAQNAIAVVGQAKPEVIYLCAARVGGIGRNMSEPGAMLYDNLMIQTNVIEAARFVGGVKLIVFLGSSCIYPATHRFATDDNNEVLKPLRTRPFEPRDLMTGPLEPTNSAYAMAKLAGIEMLKAYYTQYGLEYLVVIPCNLYGPNDNFRPGESHLMASLIRRFHEAKRDGSEQVTLWGTGTPRREMLHVDDLAAAIKLLVAQGRRGIVNAGASSDMPVSAWAEEVAGYSGYNGDILFDGDSTRDGVYSKLMKTEPIPGWEPRGVAEGINSAVHWYRENLETARR